VAQDAGLSRRKQGFETPTGRQKIHRQPRRQYFIFTKASTYQYRLVSCVSQPGAASTSMVSTFLSRPLTINTPRARERDAKQHFPAPGAFHQRASASGLDGSSIRYGVMAQFPLASVAATDCNMPPMENERAKMNRGGLLAGGGLIAALAASSCCVAPLAFAAVGLSGAWIAQLTMLAPYQPVFFALAALCITLGLWRTYRGEDVGARAEACDGALCSVSWTHRATRAALWLAAILVLISASAPWWATLLM
jgi:mercuric ion transport protein